MVTNTKEGIQKGQCKHNKAVRGLQLRKLKKLLLAVGYCQRLRRYVDQNTQGMSAKKKRDNVKVFTY